MPQRPPKFRPTHGTGTPPGDHATPATDRRPNSHQRGYTRTWRRLRAAHLAEHPLCVECERRGIVTMATDVHHRERHHGDMAKVLDPALLVSLCHQCHSRATARGE